MTSKATSKLKKLEELYGKDKGCSLKNTAKWLRSAGYNSLADLLEHPNILQKKGQR